MAESTDVVTTLEGTQAAAEDVSFAVGETFGSFDALLTRIRAYEQAKFVQLWKRDCRTIEAAKKRLNRPLKLSLKYYEVKFCCIHGGQRFKAKGKGVRSTS